MPRGGDSAKRPIVVVGGGFAGASFALAAAGPECPVLVVEAVAPESGDGGFDARSTALSWGSRQIFDSLGVWGALGDAPCPIHRIEVTDQGHLGGVVFDRREQGRDALGYVVENHALGGVLRERLAASEHIEVLAPASVASAKPVPEGMELRMREGGSERVFTAALTVLADGGRSPIAAQLGIGRQTKSYGQHALVANVALKQAHRNVAFERFTEHGPLALLPLPSVAGVHHATLNGKIHLAMEQPSTPTPTGMHRAALVWTLPETLAREYLELAEDKLLPLLRAEFGPGMGGVAGIGERASFPLRLSWAGEQARPGLALLGNAAHTLHPVAGQGFNLALRDCMALAKVVREAAARGQWPGDMAVLQTYIDAQEFDQAKTIFFTDLLVGLFAGNHAAKSAFRRLGLLALDLLPPLRRRFVDEAMSLRSI